MANYLEAVLAGPKTCSNSRAMCHRPLDFPDDFHSAVPICYIVISVAEQVLV